MTLGRLLVSPGICPLSLPADRRQRMGAPVVIPRDTILGRTFREARALRLERINPELWSGLKSCGASLWTLNEG
jgi:hypothetical protein